MQRRRSRRLYRHDYAQGLYFVTVCTHRLAHLFGEIVDGELLPSQAGKIVAKEWQRTATVRPAVELDLFVVMPNHFHGLIAISDTTPAGQAVGKGMRPNSLGAIMAQFKSIVTKQCRSLGICRQASIWQRGYHDHIVRSERALNQIRQYILSNPLRWQEDRFNKG